MHYIAHTYITHNNVADLKSDSIIVFDFIANLSFTDSTPMNLEL